MRIFLKKIIIFSVTIILSFSYVCADILVDDFDSLDDLATRTTYVGTLTVTASAARSILGFMWTGRAAGWSSDSKYMAASFIKTSDGYDFAVYENKTLKILATDDFLGNVNLYPSPWQSSLSWSPTSTTGSYYIAVPVEDSNTSNNNYVRVYKFNGNSLQYLPNATIFTSQVQFALSVTWSPNGQYLGICIDSGIKIYGFDGNRTHLITSVTYNATTPGNNNNKAVSWSYDGRYVGFLDVNSQAHLYSFDGQNLTTFLSTSSGNTEATWGTLLKFHPTNNFFAISRYYGSGYGDSSATQRVELYSYTSSGSSTLLQTISTGEGVWASDFSWSPDGSYFCTGNANMHFYSFNGTTAIQVGSSIAVNSSGGTSFAWSPDSRYVWYSGQSGTTINTISNTVVQLWNTGLNPEPSFAEATALAPSTLTNIVTSTADQFWGIDGGDLKFSSTEAVITRMRGRWEAAWSQGSLASLSFAYLLNNSLDGNFYALDQTGKVHQATSVVVGPQARINWQVLSLTSGTSPVFVSLFQGLTSLMGIDTNKVVYKYCTSSGWLNVGTSLL